MEEKCYGTRETLILSTSPETCKKHSFTAYGLFQPAVEVHCEDCRGSWLAGMRHAFSLASLHSVYSLLSMQTFWLRAGIFCIQYPCLKGKEFTETNEASFFFKLSYHT